MYAYIRTLSAQGQSIASHSFLTISTFSSPQYSLPSPSTVHPLPPPVTPERPSHPRLHLPLRLLLQLILVPRRRTRGAESPAAARETRQHHRHRLGGVLPPRAAASSPERLALVGAIVGHHPVGYHPAGAPTTMMAPPLAGHGSPAGAEEAAKGAAPPHRLLLGPLVPRRRQRQRRGCRPPRVPDL